MIKKILIANRGEIACRIIKTCRENNIETVTIGKTFEADLPHCREGNYFVDLGEGSLLDTYLNIDKLISIAKEYKVDAIHPGYGFLSENAEFAKALEKNDLILIGPSAWVMEVMGDKTASKHKVQELGVPLIPGYHGDNQDPKFLSEKAKEIGYPVLIKASAGGGGKGMRIVYQEKEFIGSLEAAKREAKKAFSNDQVLIEKFIENPRHIEVQILSDSHGNHLHFFERECSIQRRYQKIIEETPSVALSSSLRKNICETAVKVSSGVEYLGAGTIEFILDDDDHFYFLEMNTRLQVEHPITEMITGVDLVKWQIQVAAGEKLPWKQEDITVRGHALEVRVYAEDPDNSFLPSTGVIKKVGIPKLNNVRLDTGYIDNSEITIDFDPMCAKIIVHGETREDAINKMCLSLDDVPFLGPKNNLSYLKRVLKHPKFLLGETYTHFIETFKSDLEPREISVEMKALAACFKLLKEDGAKSSHHRPQEMGHGSEIYNFRNI